MLKCTCTGGACRIEWLIGLGCCIGRCCTQAACYASGCHYRAEIKHRLSPGIVFYCDSVPCIRREIALRFKPPIAVCRVGGIIVHFSMNRPPNVSGLFLIHAYSKLCRRRIIGMRPIHSNPGIQSDISFLVGGLHFNAIKIASIWRVQLLSLLAATTAARKN